MADLYPVAGWRIYIGGTKASQTADFVEADFSGESWTEIDGWSQMGSFGDAAQTITTALINRGRDSKQKGTANAGSMENVFAWVPGDAGQAALVAAAAPSVKNNYAFKITASDTGGATPTTYYFIALAMSSQRAGGDANTILNINATLEINSNIVEVAAT